MWDIHDFPKFVQQNCSVELGYLKRKKKTFHISTVEFTSLLEQICLALSALVKQRKSMSTSLAITTSTPCAYTMKPSTPPHLG